MQRTKREFQLDRREVVSLIGMLVALSGCRTRFSEILAPNAIDHAIDVHCHVFNGQDVPAGEFVLNIAAREADHPEVASIVAFFVEILRRFAPTASHEEERLSEPDNPSSLSLSDSDFHSHILDTLTGLAPKAKFKSSMYLNKEPLFEHLRTWGAAPDQKTLRVDGQYPNAEALALATLRENYGASRLLEFKPGVPLGAPKIRLNSLDFLKGAAPDVRNNFVQLSDAMVKDAKAASEGNPFTVIGLYLALIRVFLSYRIENVKTLDAALGLAKPGRTRLYCPAVIDYDMWLGADFIGSSTPLDKQAEVMSKVPLRTEPDVLVNGFMAFDPLREVIDRHQGLTGERTALGIAQKAVRELGFVGVKLYPPMGFRPWTNEGSRQNYGESVKKTLDHYSIKPDDKLNADLDHVLEALYQFCLDEDVPILAHCGNSQTAFVGSGLRASPDYWKSLLQRGIVNGRNYGALRVNLGHFGGIWCQADDLKPGSDEAGRCADEVGWPKEIIELVKEKSNGDWAYPNLSFDVADVSALDRQAGRDKLTSFLTGMLGTGSEREHVLSRMMYGTDWMFLSLDRDYRQFVFGTTEFAKAIGADVRDLFWRNAARFLGLSTGSKTATRLLNFYNRDEAKKDSLLRIMV